jgi:hypothetical protein
MPVEHNLVWLKFLDYTSFINYSTLVLNWNWAKKFTLIKHTFLDFFYAHLGTMPNFFKSSSTHFYNMCNIWTDNTPDS